LLRGIDYIYDECPHAKGATTILYKELLNQLEARSRGAKQQFYLSFLQARAKQGLFQRDDEELELGECERCGQPTTAPRLCAFCRLWEAG
jgi:tRNA(Ile)-lysidine synthase TilS/MesJ